MKYSIKALDNLKLVALIGLFVLLSCKNCLYILDTSLLSNTCFESIFFQPMACFLIFLMVIFQKAVLSFEEVVYQFFLLWLVLFFILPEKSVSNPRLQRFLPMFYSFRNFIVLALTSRSVIHFKLIFWCEVKVQHFHMDILLFSTIC